MWVRSLQLKMHFDRKEQQQQPPTMPLCGVRFEKEQQNVV